MKMLPLAATLFALACPALAQTHSDHQQHHPGAPAPQMQAQPQTPAPAQPQGRMPMGQMMQGMGGMTGNMMSGHPGMAGSGRGMGSSGMMSCPMMQGGMMAGRPAAGATQNRDESVSSLAFRAVNEKMHRDMAIDFSGNVDADFAKAMIAHHQGAIDMAKITVAFGKDPQIRKLAEDVIKAQEAEIRTMRDWLQTNAK